MKTYKLKWQCTIDKSQHGNWEWKLLKLKEVGDKVQITEYKLAFREKHNPKDESQEMHFVNVEQDVVVFSL